MPTDMANRRLAACMIYGVGDTAPSIFALGGHDTLTLTLHARGHRIFDQDHRYNSENYGLLALETQAVAAGSKR